jgi:Flp pilus assembly protein TadD
MRTVLAMALGAAVLAAMPAGAADNPQTVSARELAEIRARIKDKDYKGAIKSLNNLVDFGIVDADVFNLLAFSLRKDGNLEQAGVYYRRALGMNPNHKGALEYQGELFLQLGDRAGAERNLARLRGLCPSGCEELEDLEEAIKDADKKKS